MTDAAAVASPAAAAARSAGGSGGGATAGALLRAARERRGLSVAALAAAVKVPPRKLEALEADRYDQLPDPTFTRALARTLCRVLAIDALAVVALLPAAPNLGPGLEQVHNGLKTPLRPRADAVEAAIDWRLLLRRPALWLPLLLALAALWVYLMPQSWIARTRLAGGAEPPSPDAAVVSAAPAAPAPSAVTEVVVPADAPPPAASATATAAPSVGLVQLRASADAWVEVVDARGAALLQRTLRAGETVGLDGTPPLRVKIGNASTVRLAFRGQPVDLTAATRDNVARLELK